MAPKDKKKKLTAKESAFVDYYFICGLNGYQAAIKAGYSERSAYEIASQNLRKLHIQEAIQARLSEVHMSADEALALLATHARGDIGDFMQIGPMGYSLDMNKAKEMGITRLVKKIKQETITINGKYEDKEIHTETIELHDPQAAIEKILRVGGKLKDTNLTINVKLTDD